MLKMLEDKMEDFLMKQKIIRMAAVLIFFAVSSVLLGTVDEYQRAVQLDGNSVINRYNLGNAYYEEHQYEASVESLKKALEMNKDDKEAHEKVDFKSAQIIGIIDYNFLNNTDDALKYFEIAASINPSDGNISYYTGLAYKKAGNNEKSLQALLKAIKNKADDQPEINFRIGQLYYEKKDYLNAINFFEKAVSLKSDFIEAREYLGDIYDRRGNADKAVENYMSVVRVNPNNLHAQFELGINYSKQKEYDKMILAYKKAISIDPSFADAHYNLGMAYFYRNMYEDAITEFQTAIKLKPEDAAAYSLLAQTKTTAYEYHKSKGSAFLTEDDLLLARDEFVKAMAVKPGDTETQKFLDITNENIKKAVPVRLEKAKNDFDSKKYSDAYSGWDFVLKADPLNNDAKEGMAKIEKNLGELIAAREI
jgi:tetratricopeptide (TPR) repeat protein